MIGLHLVVINKDEHTHIVIVNNTPIVVIGLHLVVINKDEHTHIVLISLQVLNTSEEIRWRYIFKSR